MSNRIWIKLIKDNKIIKDIIFVSSKNDVQNQLLEKCKELDISQPIWSNKNIRDWENHGITRFSESDFIDDFQYDSMELSFVADKKSR